jgi:hypothetical protein
MSEDQQDAIIGRTLREYQAARKHLAALRAEAESLGHYLIGAGNALRENHNLWSVNNGIYSADVDLKKWPTAEELKKLVNEIIAAQGEKNRLAGILKDAGFERPE